MLGRRNLRIKVMQCLYSWRMDEGLSLDYFNHQLSGNVEKFRTLYAVNLAYLIAICRYAETDVEMRSAKYLKSEEDLAARSTLSQNSLVVALQNSAGLQQLLEKEKAHNYLDKGVVKGIFQKLTATPAYKEYIAKSEHKFVDDRAILLHLLEQFMCCTPELQQHLEEFFRNYADDNDYMLNTLHKQLHAMKQPDMPALVPNDETIAEELDFGKSLLQLTYRHSQALEDTIKPALKNWDMERVASLDLVMLKMAVCELLHFPVIPVKVTINEYIDIAKYYSTPRSKDFVNGVLDHLRVNLSEAGLIKKSGRGLVDR